MSKESILLIRCEDNEPVEASLLGELKPNDLRLVERVWTLKRQEMMRDLVSQGVPRKSWPQSLHWDWSAKAHELTFLSHFGWAIECEDDFQGVMLVDLASHFADLEEDRGKPVLYIEYLEAAPWNWDCPELSQKKTYCGIGTTLFQRAVEQSNEQGFHGRIGLHALPQAESFYQQACGMTRFGKDPDKEGLVYFELSRAEVAKRLNQEDKTMPNNTVRNTKLRDEKWLRKMADLEDQHTSVSVGGMACDLGLLTMSQGRPTGVFGRFVEFARRKQKLTVEELAERAEVDLGDLVAIEQEPDARPQIMTVHRLATYLKLPPKPLMELAGLMEAKSGSIGSAALRFAAQSETTAELSPQETQAFDEFVKAIVEASDS